MAQIDATGQIANFDALNPVNSGVASFSGAGSIFGWATGVSPAGFFFNALSFLGDLTAAPLGGTVNAVAITTNQTSPLTALNITDISISLPSLIDTGNVATNHEKFWEAVLAGETDVLLGGQAALSLTGDFMIVNAGQVRTGAADRFLPSFQGAFIPSSRLIGDALTVETGATFTGGADTFQNVVTTTSLIGDLATNAGGTVTGGADLFTLTDVGATPTQFINNIVGDVEVSSGGTVQGGRDTITVTNALSASQVYGDVVSVTGGTATGDIDTIVLQRTINDAQGINFFSITGDFGNGLAGTTTIGRGDTIVLSSASGSQLAGDVLSSIGAVTGGNDTITVQNTNPQPPSGSPSFFATVGVLAGDAISVTGAGSLTGGRDTITVTNASVSTISGDAPSMSGSGAFIAGNDTINITITRQDLSPVFIFTSITGDASSVDNSSLFDAGNDIMTFTSGPGMGPISITMFGDATLYSSASGQFIGGDDIITFNGGANSTSFLIGDVNSLTAATVHFGNDTLTGGAGNDTLQGEGVTFIGAFTGGNDILDGRGGNDALNGGQGIDTALFSLDQSVYVNLGGIGSTGFHAVGQGFDSLTAIENVIGSSKNDTIVGDANVNRLEGGGGNDLLRGGAGNDTMIGGAGNDTYFFEESGDVIEEAAGNGSDTIIAGASINLAARPVAAGIEHVVLVAGVSNLSITGTETFNTLTGNGGNNTINGLGGNDTIVGGGGTDTINGGANKDTMTGGTGAADIFVFSLATDTAVNNRDVITDFEAGLDDINLAAIDANGAGAGEGSFTFLTAEGAAFTGVAGQLRFDQQGTITLIEGDTNGDSIADFAIELTGLKALTAADFVP